MPRQRRGPAPSRSSARPTVAPARPAPSAQQQTRPATTAAYPPAQKTAAPPAQAPTQSNGPGLFGQMASTAAYVTFIFCLSRLKIFSFLGSEVSELLELLRCGRGFCKLLVK